MSVRLSELTFDVSVFANYPKCAGKWSDENGAGCLWTAFMAGYGFRQWAHPSGLTYFEGHGMRFLAAESEMVALINRLTEDVGAVDYEGYGDFMDYTIELFDNHRESAAVKLMWKLICKLPNKVGNTTTVVQMPAECAPVEVSCA